MSVALLGILSIVRACCACNFCVPPPNTHPSREFAQPVPFLPGIFPVKPADLLARLSDPVPCLRTRRAGAAAAGCTPDLCHFPRPGRLQGGYKLQRTWLQAAHPRALISERVPQAQGPSPIFKKGLGGGGRAWRRRGPRESHGQRSLVGYSPWGRKESDTTEQLSTHTQYHSNPEQVLPLAGLLWHLHTDQSLWSFKKENVRS